MLQIRTPNSIGTVSSLNWEPLGSVTAGSAPSTGFQDSGNQIFDLLETIRFFPAPSAKYGKALALQRNHIVAALLLPYLPPGIPYPELLLFAFCGHTGNACELFRRPDATAIVRKSHVRGGCAKLCDSKRYASRWRATRCAKHTMHTPANDSHAGPRFPRPGRAEHAELHR